MAFSLSLLHSFSHHFFFLFTLNSPVKTRCFQTPRADVKMKRFGLQRATWWLSTIPDRKHEETDRQEREKRIKAHLSWLKPVDENCSHVRKDYTSVSFTISGHIHLANLSLFPKWFSLFRWCCLAAGTGTGPVSLGPHSETPESTYYHTS